MAGHWVRILLDREPDDYRAFALRDKKSGVVKAKLYLDIALDQSFDEPKQVTIQVNAGDQLTAELTG